MDTEQLFILASPLLAAVIGVIAKSYIEERSKIISYLGHVSTFALQDDEEPKSFVYTHSVIVRNAGRKTAKNIRLGHDILPANFNIYPKVQYSIEYNPEGSAEILIPTLVPKEQVTISYLYFPPLTVGKINTYTKSDDGLAKIIDVIPIPRPARWALFMEWIFMFIGASFLLYWLMKIIANLI